VWPGSGARGARPADESRNHKNQHNSQVFAARAAYNTTAERQ
jgi:hypothetical protein